jgi:hypothetical protein
MDTQVTHHLKQKRGTQVKRQLNIRGYKSKASLKQKRGTQVKHQLNRRGYTRKASLKQTRVHK